MGDKLMIRAKKDWGKTAPGKALRAVESFLMRPVLISKRRSANSPNSQKEEAAASGRQKRIQQLFNRELSAEEKRAAEESIRQSIRLALEQDCSSKNITANSVSHKLQETAHITFKQNGVVSGLFELEQAFKLTDPQIKVELLAKEGQTVKAGTRIAKISGPARSILSAERTALDYLSILSGIATSARKAKLSLEKKGLSPNISGLRKVHPGMLWSEKRALKAGGAFTHRYNLSDGYLLKENNIRQIQKELGCSWTNAIKEGVKRAEKDRQEKRSSSFIEVEVYNLAGALAAAQAKADAILLDNMPPHKVEKVVREARKINPEIIIEASGGITEKNAHKYLRAGADFVSTSRLTIGSTPADVSMLSDGAVSQEKR